MSFDNDTSISYKKKLFVHRSRIFGVILIIAIMIMITAVICYNSYNSRLYDSYAVVSEVEHTNIEGSRVLSFGMDFITYSSDGIRCSNSKGTDEWSFPYEMQSPMIDVRGKYVACADYNGRNIYIFDTTGPLGTIQLNNPVKKICVSATGVIAAVIDNGDVTPISLYYYDGRQIASFRTTMSKSGYPVDVSISDDSKLVAVSYMYMDSGKLTTKLAFYNFGEVGQNETDNLVSGYDYEDEVIPSVAFLNSKSVFALANDKLLFFEGKERPVNIENRMLSDRVYAVFHGDEKVGLVYLNDDGESRYRIEIYNDSGKLENTFYFDVDYSDIFFANGRVVIYNSGQAVIYTYSGILKFRGSFEENVSLLLPTSSNLRYVAVTPDSIKTIELQ